MKFSGTISRGVRTPIIKKGDDLPSIVVESLGNCIKEAGIELNDRDVVAVTEAVVGISQGNYATADQIGKDVKNKFGDATVGLIFPIMSRNRFSMLLRGISRGCKKLVIMLSYPGDEVGNKLISPDELLDSGINPYTDVFTAEEFHKIFPNTVHQFTGVDYIQYYKEAYSIALGKVIDSLGAFPDDLNKDKPMAYNKIEINSPAWKSVMVTRHLPEALSGLETLSKNLWWC